ncbi:IDEAL domain-containing protein [Bacillus marinisedimentorum]|uniref:IDEAL domain-containing protein n=1 Tax=Bacillus marinisedimentorum TaxID=1821260 RepID=UPI0008727992|nr:IDEAL domain-containing protein [Bacillus marinisedimentorum]
MQNERSYQEKMKEQAMKRQQKGNKALEVYVQMILDESLHNFRKEKLEEKINHALDTRNYESFVKLSSQYNKLLLNT